MGPQKLRDLIDSESTFCKVFSLSKRMDPLNIEDNPKSMHLLSSNFHRRRIAPETRNNEFIFYAKSTFPPKVHAAEQENMMLQLSYDFFVTQISSLAF